MNVYALVYLAAKNVLASGGVQDNYVRLWTLGADGKSGSHAAALNYGTSIYHDSCACNHTLRASELT